MQVLRCWLVSLWFCALLWVPPAAARQSALMSATEIRSSIQQIARELQQGYLDPVKAKDASDKLLSTLASGGFDRAFDQARFHHEVSTLLIQTTGDRNISLLPNDMTVSTTQSTAHALSTAADDQIRVEVSADNIGYLSLQGQLTPAHSQLLLKQLKFLASVDALIIDLRLADEASLSFVQQLLSHFVPADTPLMDVKFNHRLENLTAAPIAGFRHLQTQVPLFILTSSFVAGSWEFFCYSLQQLGRANIVGEVTMGLSQLSKVVKVSDATSLRMSYAAFSHPRTGESWHLEGVLPDYYFRGEAALAKAQQLAIGSVRK
jgi:C-terminal processing protease CtpA/Prc